MSMDIFTTQVAKSSNAQSAQKSAGAPGQGLSLQGLNFFDMFLQNVAKGLEEAGDSTKQEQVVNTTLTSEGETTNANIADINALLVSNDTLTIDDESNLSIEDIENFKNLFIQVEQTENTSDLSLQDALLIEEVNAKPALFDLQRFVQKLDQLIEEESPVLTSVFNITPEQLTKLQIEVDNILERIDSGEKIRDIMSGEDTEEFAGLFGAIVQMLPPQAKQDVLFSAQNFAQSSTPTTMPTSSGLQNDVAARLNNLVIGVNDANFGSPQSDDGLNFDDFDQALQQIMKGEKGSKDGGLENILQNIGKSSNTAGLENAVNNGQTAQLQGWPFSLSGSLFAPISYSDSAYNELGIPTAGNSSVTSLSPLTALVTQSHSATQAHPGTQIIAASIKKMAGNGETKNVRIQLDPPELGRVEIKMTLNKNKTVQAVLTAEKPETFMMMQRDAQILERALQDAGIDTDGSDLSFELAQDEQDFGQDGSHDGSRNEARGGDGEQDEEIIESTMTWHVDPATGHMRYDILV